MIKDLEQAGFLESGGRGSHRSDLIEDAIGLYAREGRPLPQPMSGREFVSALQRTA